MSDCRARIDALDRQLLALLARRMEVSQRIGALKKRHNRPVRDPEREARLLEDLAVSAPTPLTPEMTRTIWSAILDASCALQQ